MPKGRETDESDAARWRVAGVTQLTLLRAGWARFRAWPRRAHHPAELVKKKSQTQRRWPLLRPNSAAAAPHIFPGKGDVTLQSVLPRARSDSRSSCTDSFAVNSWSRPQGASPSSLFGGEALWAFLAVYYIVYVPRPLRSVRNRLIWPEEELRSES